MAHLHSELCFSQGSARPAKRSTAGCKCAPFPLVLGLWGTQEELIGPSSGLYPGCASNLPHRKQHNERIRETFASLWFYIEPFQQEASALSQPVGCFLMKGPRHPHADFTVHPTTPSNWAELSPDASWEASWGFMGFLEKRVNCRFSQ